MNSNYNAVVVRINNIRPHPNANRLQLTNIFGNTVILGLETKQGDVGLFFPLEAKIGLEFAKANDLLRRKDENGKIVGGLFDENRRVRAQKLRGIPSMGFWVELEALAKLTGNAPTDFREGDEIEKIGDFIISQKYIPRTNPSPKPKEGRKPRESRIIPDQFRFHTETAQLGKNIHKIQPSDIIAITWKMHGTSAIAARVRTKRKLNLLEKFVKKIGILPINDTEYSMVYASRRVVKNEFQEAKDHYYGTDIWTETGKENFEGKLHTGETVYYEIVGYTKDGSPIQKGFDYGCNPDGVFGRADGALLPHCKNKIYVYRITQTAFDGAVTELQWNQVKERCKEIGVETVPEIFYGEADITFAPTTETVEQWQSQYLEYLKKRFVKDQDSQFCLTKVPEEGIVVRKEGLVIEAFKLKSFRFLELETKSLDKGEVDIETQQTEFSGEDENLIE